MSSRHIRPVALCVFRNHGRILVFEGYNRTKKQHFYRPLGGRIEFEESSREAAAREIKEELGADVENLRHLGTLENIFTHRRKPRHEIVFIYDGTFVDKSLYEPPFLMAVEGNRHEFKALWKNLSDFDPDRLPLYPNGLLELLRNERNDYLGLFRNFFPKWRL
jgi:8-oxo-dGTP pyrophosphatase MutT (NUDIX family)